MARQRTDIHRPGVIEPSEYEYILTLYPIEGSFYGIDTFNLPSSVLQRHILSTGGKMAGIGRGGCDICGAAHKYSDIFFHTQSKEYIRVGQTCGSKLFGENAERFRLAKDRAKFIAGKKKCAFLLETEGLQECLEIAYLTKTEDWHNIFKYEVDKIKDIVATIEKKGTLSEKQSDYLRSLLSKLYSKNAYHYDMAIAEIPPLKTGRQEVTGKAVHTKWVESGYGGTTKMLFLTDNGQKIWATMPSGMMSDIEEGESYTIKVTIEESDKANFYFGSRPSLVKK